MNFRGEVSFLRCVSGNTLGSDDEFITKLKKKISLKEEFNLENCDFILVFCPVVSRAGTDIEAALKKLQNLSESKPVVLVVLHHTFNQEFTAPDSSSSVNRENTLTVDCLFHEDRGLLQCYRNQEALEKVTHWIKPLVSKPLMGNPTFMRTITGPTATEMEYPTKALKQEQQKSERMAKRLKDLEEENNQLQLQLQQKERMLGDMTTVLQKINKTLDPIIVNNQKHLEDKQFKQLSDRLNEVKIQLKIPEKEILDISPDLRLVLLGRAGSVKSSVGNSILKNREFGTSTPTQGYKIRQGFVGNKSLTVLETPDELFSEFPQEEIRHCVRLSAPGPHAFLIVIPVKEWTGEERGMLEEMEEKFGEKCWRNTIILLTVTDEEQKKSVEEFIRSGNQEVQRLVEKCGNRFHCLNVQENRDDAQVLDLLEKIEKMLKDNPERFYSREIYQQIREMERRVMEVIIRKTQEHIVDYEIYINKLSGYIKESQKGKFINVKDEDFEAIREKVIKRNEKLKLEQEELQRRCMQEVKEMKVAYDGEGWMKKKKELMKIILPEIHSMLWDLKIRQRKQEKNKLPEPQTPNPAELRESINTETDQRTVKNSDSERVNPPEETPDNTVQKEFSSGNTDVQKSSEAKKNSSSRVLSDLSSENPSNTKIQCGDKDQKEYSNGNTNAEKSPEKPISNVPSDHSADKVSPIKIQHSDTDQMDTTNKSTNKQGSPMSDGLCPKDVSDPSSSDEIKPVDEFQNKSSEKNADAGNGPVDEGARSNVPSDHSPENHKPGSSSSENDNAGESSVVDGTCTDVLLDNTSTIKNQPEEVQKEPSNGNANTEKSPVSEGSGSSVSSDSSPENTSNTEVQRTDKDQKESSSENRKAETSPVVEDTSSSVSSAEAPENTYL